MQHTLLCLKWEMDACFVTQLQLQDSTWQAWNYNTREYLGSVLILKELIPLVFDPKCSLLSNKRLSWLSLCNHKMPFRIQQVATKSRGTYGSQPMHFPDIEDSNPELETNSNCSRAQGRSLSPELHRMPTSGEDTAMADSCCHNADDDNTKKDDNQCDYNRDDNYISHSKSGSTQDTRSACHVGRISQGPITDRSIKYTTAKVERGGKIRNERGVKRGEKLRRKRTTPVVMFKNRNLTLALGRK